MQRVEEHGNPVTNPQW